MIRVLGIYFFDTSTKVVVFAGQEAEQLHSLTQTKVGPIRTWGCQPGCCEFNSWNSVMYHQVVADQQNRCQFDPYDSIWTRHKKFPLKLLCTVQL